MLTNEEIKNLRIGDAIYVEDQVYKVTNLSMHNITTNYTISFSHCFLLDPDNFISLNPPKTKKKYWLWAVQERYDSEIYRTMYYYDANLLSLSGKYTVKDLFFARRIDNTMEEFNID